MKAILRTDTGLVRKINEDAAFAGDGLYVVCDGMGGHQAGDIASNEATRVLSGELNGKEPSIRLLLSAIAKANERVFRHAAAEKSLRGMGTTLTALWMDEDQVMIAQVGDSRAYLLRGGVLRQCTHDHSMVAELVRMGSITPAQAKTHPNRNLITRSLGTEPRVEADVFEVGRRSGDIWLLCSDGLTGHVSDGEIADILQNKPFDSAADTLVSLALSRGGTDNITILLLLDEGGGKR